MRRSHLARYLAALFVPVGDRLTWQTFGERADVRGARKLARTWTAPAREALPELRRLNNAGAGVFMCVQHTDGRGRKAGNITKIRALFVDIEDTDDRTWHLDPALIVRTGKGRHAYWCVADDMPLSEFKSAQRRLAAMYRADPAVHDLPRVMRVAGSDHNKGEPIPVEVEHHGPWGLYPWREILRDVPEIPAPAPRKVATRAALAMAGGMTGNGMRDAVDVHTLRLTDMFTDLGMARDDRRAGGLSIVCPWSDRHSGESVPSATMVWDGVGDRPAGFKCMHAHCVDRTLADVLRKYRDRLHNYGRTVARPSNATQRSAAYLSALER